MHINDDAIRAAMRRHPAGKNRPLRLTNRGENVVLAIYQALLIAVAIATFLLVMGLVGWIEGN